MAEALNTDLTIQMISAFRALCRNAGLSEMDAVSLVSHHDASIRFTNSTTSVMKPYLLHPADIPQPGVFLVQPALGLQGVAYWLGNKDFGRFSSFFLSFGVLLPIHEKRLCFDVVTDFLRAFFPLDKIRFRFCALHKDKLMGVQDLFAAKAVSDEPTSDFTHSYGLSDMTGYDILIGAMHNGRIYDFGNISVIWNGCAAACIEFSFDSTLLLSAVNNRHAVLCLPAFDAASLERIPLESGTALPFLDLSELTCMLYVDGLRVGSRGRRGNLKTAYNELIRIAFQTGISEGDFFSFLTSLLSLEGRIIEELRYRPINDGKSISERLFAYYIEYISKHERELLKTDTGSLNSGRIL